MVESMRQMQGNVQLTIWLRGWPVRGLLIKAPEPVSQIRENGTRKAPCETNHHYG